MVNSQKIKGRMREKGLTQADVAKVLGIDPSTLNKRLNNLSGEHLTVLNVNKLIDLLDIPKEELSHYFFC